MVRQPAGQTARHRGDRSPTPTPTLIVACWAHMPSSSSDGWRRSCRIERRSAGSVKSSSSKVAAYRCSVSGCSPSSPSSAVMSRSLPAMARSGVAACYADLWRGAPARSLRKNAATRHEDAGAANVERQPGSASTPREFKLAVTKAPCRHKTPRSSQGPCAARVAPTLTSLSR